MLSAEAHICFQSWVKGPLRAKHLWILVMSFLASSWFRKVFFGSEISISYWLCSMTRGQKSSDKKHFLSSAKGNKRHDFLSRSVLISSHLICLKIFLKPF